MSDPMSGPMSGQMRASIRATLPDRVRAVLQMRGPVSAARRQRVELRNFNSEDGGASDGA